MPKLKTHTILKQLNTLVFAVTSKVPGFRINPDELNILITPSINLRDPSTYKQKLKELIESKVDQYLSGLQLPIDTKNTLKQRIQDRFTKEFDHFEEGIDASSVLGVYGAQKDTKAQHKTHSDVKAGSHEIARAVMRNPKPEMRAELNKIHQMLKDEFATMSDKEITWLLQGAPAARGGFKDPASFRKFLQSPPESITSSRLITAIDSISTAIGYRSIGVGWAKPPHRPEPNHPAHRMYVKVRDKFAPRIVPFIAEKAYNTRYYDSYSPQQTSTVGERHVEVFPDDVSEASDVDYQEEKLPRERLGGQKYRDAIDPSSDKYSWPAAAAHGNIPIRAHVSGSAPIVLSVISALYEDKKDPWFQNNGNIRCFAGAVLIPTYERGDFHSTAETTAALEYFLTVKNGGPISVKSPQECFQIGLDCMASATNGELESAIRRKSEELLSMTTNKDFVAQIGSDDMSGILANCKNTVLLQTILSSQLPQQTSDTLAQWIGCCKDKKATEMIVRQALSTIMNAPESANKKMAYLCALYEKIGQHDALREERGFFSLFGKTGNTKSYQRAAKEIKNVSLLLLQQTPPGTFSEHEVGKIKEILQSTRGRLPALYSSSANSPHLRAHTDQIQKFKALKQECAEGRKKMEQNTQAQEATTGVVDEHSRQMGSQTVAEASLPEPEPADEPEQHSSLQNHQ